MRVKNEGSPEVILLSRLGTSCSLMFAAAPKFPGQISSEAHVGNNSRATAYTYRSPCRWQDTLRALRHKIVVVNPPPDMGHQREMKMSMTCLATRPVPDPVARLQAEVAEAKAPAGLDHPPGSRKP
jgi:hypothetical protein